MITEFRAEREHQRKDIGKLHVEKLIKQSVFTDVVFETDIIGPVKQLSSRWVLIKKGVPPTPVTNELYVSGARFLERCVCCCSHV